MPNKPQIPDVGWPGRLGRSPFGQDGRQVPGSPPGVPSPLPDLPGLPGGDPRYKWTSPLSALSFIAADQNNAFDTRLWLGAGTPVVRAIVQSPVIDTRPDLRKIDGYEPGGEPVELVTQSGIALELFWRLTCTQITGQTYTGMFPMTAPAGNPMRVRVTYVEFGDPVNPNRVQAYTEPIDITADVFTGNGNTCTTIQRFEATGPLRYWQVGFAIDIVTADFALRQGPIYSAMGFY